MRNAIVAIARVAFVVGLVQAPTAYAAGGVVGTGTAASCTETAFDAMFFTDLARLARSRTSAR